MRPRFGGPKLPKELRDQIGDPANRSKANRRNTGPLNRKERRKAERAEKKVQKKQTPRRNGFRQNRVEPDGEEEEEELFSEQEDSPPPKQTPVLKESQKLPKSILKKARPDGSTKESRESSPSPPPRVSRAVKERLAQDDAEIAALEKKLGIKNKKSKHATDDGLADLFGDLGALDSEEDQEEMIRSKRKRPGDDEWLASKRRKALGQPAEGISSGDEFGSGSDSDDADDLDGLDESGSDEDVDPDDGIEEVSDFDGFESDEKEEPAQPRVRENPYVAPVPSATVQTAKYIPPSQRGPPSSDAEALTRLRRQIQGLLNRLSDANMLTILRDIEQIYQTNARGYVNTTVVDLLIGLLSDETTLMDTFLILHGGFLAAIYKVVGPDFGAQMIERIVGDFEKHYESNKSGSGKQTTNLASLLAELYTFQVIGSNLMFDYIRFFLGELSEINTELLLRIVKIAGSQLRQDDPTALKDIVLLLQKAVAKVGESSLPVRTKFMIETINNLKNNRVKTGVAASAVVSEHTTRMKKQLGTLNSRNLKGTEPMRIGLADIKDTEKKGKWWLVGASWRNDTVEPSSIEKSSLAKSKNTSGETVDDEGEVSLLQLAREQRMNTDIRRSIFITIMSAADYKDAHVRLMKLNLKKSQEMEIPRVIIHCAGSENTYNPYYTLLARKFCSEHKIRKGFQFALWDIFKKLDEKRDDDGSGDEGGTAEDTSLRRLVNLGKLYGTLVARDGVPITTLKPLNFPYLQPKTKTFVEILLVTVILQSQKGAKDGKDEKGLLNIFVKADQAPEMIAGLQYFLQKVVSRTDIAANKGEKETVGWACKAVVVMLTRLLATTQLNDE